MVFIQLLIFKETWIHANVRDPKRFSQKEEILTDKKDLKKILIKRRDSHT